MLIKEGLKLMHKLNLKGEIDMTQKIAIIATDGYEDLELHYPRIRLHEAGYDTDLIGIEERVIKGKHGYPIKTDLSIKDAKADDYEGLVLPGGAENPDHLRRHEEVLDFVRKINNEKMQKNH